MPDIFNALPGLEVPVGSITKSLNKMWVDTASSGGPAPAAEDGKATQVNLVLHLGFGTKPEDAAAQFDTAVRFSRRYPARVVVLCPLPPEEPGTEIRAKIYGECHLGKSKGDTRCCEFVVLSYPQSARQFLENHVSVCLSTDLPLYYWAHRFSSSNKLADYRYLLGRSLRVMFDSAIVPAGALEYPWPRPEAVRDLVYARLLPVRQTIGQFLSSFAPGALVEGIQAVTVKHGSSFSAEARVIALWAKRRLVTCGGAASLPVNILPDSGAIPRALSLNFEYSDGQHFSWKGDFAQGNAQFDAKFGSTSTTLPTAISLLSPEAALGEAMFF